MSSDVDAYVARAKRWRTETAQLRSILADCGLEEALKWGKPCYAVDGKNVAIIQPMKAFLALMFFKGALLSGPDGVLQEQGENTQSARRLCFTSVGEVVEMEAVLRDLVRQAIDVERSGRSLPKRTALAPVEELRARLDADPELAAAFNALTPGRQRAYNIYFSGAKQAKTRAARVEKCVPAILAGKGLRDR